MKKLTRFFFVAILFFSFQQSIFSQTQEEDMAKARTHFNNARQFEQEAKLDDALSNYLEASSIYKKYEVWKNYLICELSASNLMTFQADYENALSHLIEIESKSTEIYGETTSFVAAVYHSLGEVYYQKAENNKSLEYFDKCLLIKMGLHGDYSVEVAVVYNSIANVYAKIGRYEMALDYYLLNVAIIKSLHGKNHQDLGVTYTNIANIYNSRGEYDKAIEYKETVIKLMSNYYGENNPEVAEAYSGIGNAYIEKKEYETAKEYILKAIKLKEIVYGEGHLKVADEYVNLGIIYNKIDNLDMSIQYYFVALDIYTAILGDKHPEVAAVYNNIGLVCNQQGSYSQALEYYETALKIKNESLGEMNPETASIYTNIGEMYFRNNENEKAIENYNKAITINKSIFGIHHPNIVEPYSSIANIYFNNNDFEQALQYFQYSIIGNINGFTSTDYYVISPVDKFYDSFKYLRSLHGKARSFYLKYENKKKLNDLEYALNTFLACDSLISILRKVTTAEKDKIALGEITTEIYENAIISCIALNKKTKKDKYNEIAFYFSERNKSGTLLQALAGAKAQRFAGIPDTLLEQEKSIRMKITYYEQMLAELVDYSKEQFYRDNIFKLNKQYQELITYFEVNYPKYYQMKYDNKFASVSDIQSTINDNTAMLNYFVGENNIFLFVVTKKGLSVYNSNKIEDFDKNVETFNSVILSYYPEDVKEYQELAFILYDQLLPVNLPKKIEKLIVIPDGILGTISFEALFYEEYNGELKEYVSFPFLIKKYNICYSYSANLFYSIFNQNNSQYTQNRPSKEWFGIAPVFREDNPLVVNYEDITTIEGTETEVNTIQGEFKTKKFTAEKLLNKNASETEFKKLDIDNYKIIHIATHGIANSEMPELSAILLSKNPNTEDNGILYAGEIYNIQLNSDLVVLSACETALGKISKGEGVIGLSRAILYAGSRNMMLSLWKVADKATMQVMIYFYQKLLEENNDFDEMPEFSTALHNAKMQIIEEGKYAHPYFWSSFILIGN